MEGSSFEPDELPAGGRRVRRRAAAPVQSPVTEGAAIDAGATRRAFSAANPQPRVAGPQSAHDRPAQSPKPAQQASTPRSEAPQKAARAAAPKGPGMIERLRADKRPAIFAGVICLIAATYITIAFISYIVSAGPADQSIVISTGLDGAIAASAQVKNAAGPFGAWIAETLISNTFGLGSLVIPIYLCLLGLGLVGLRRLRFWSLTAKSLISLIAISVVIGMVTYQTPTSFFWGGLHGHDVNEFLLNVTGIWGMIGVSIILVAALVMIFLKQITYTIGRVSRFISDRREAARLRRDEAAKAKEEPETDAAGTNAEPEREQFESPADDSAPEEGPHPAEGHSATDAPEVTFHGPADSQTEYDEMDYSDDTDEPDNIYRQGPSAIRPTAPLAPSVQHAPSRTSALDDTLDSALDSTNASSPGASATPSAPATPSTPAAPSAPATPSTPAAPSIPSPAAAPQPSGEPQVTVATAAPIEVARESSPATFDAPIPETRDSSDHYDPTAELSRFRRPGLDLLIDRPEGENALNEEEQQTNIDNIRNMLGTFGISIARIEATVGPTVTLYEIVPAEGVRINRIRSLEDDLALSLSAIGIRIIAPMPGKGTIGIEVPNKKARVVSIRSILASKKYQESTAELPMAMGATISNDVYIADLTRMPHLLVAGSTGMGKSVGLNTIIASILYKKHPAEVKFVLIDPKMVEFSLYNKIERHYLAALPGEDEAIITDMNKVVPVLQSLCLEMDQRYELLKAANVRAVKEYNEKFINLRLNPNKGHRYMPYIVVVIDEFADLIMTAGKDVETPIARIAQKARAVGIHVILATQRPSANIITGVIRANFPGRIAFRVTQQLESRIILDRAGANQLIGRGDMLFSRDGVIERVQCAFIDTPEVEAICDHIASQVGYSLPYQLPEYVPEGGGGAGGDGSGLATDRDPLFEDAARLIIQENVGSTSLIQRRFEVGYPRAGKIMDQLEKAGIVGAAQGGKPRKVNMTLYELEQWLASTGTTQYQPLTGGNDDF